MPRVLAPRPSTWGFAPIYNIIYIINIIILYFALNVGIRAEVRWRNVAAAEPLIQAHAIRCLGEAKRRESASLRCLGEATRGGSSDAARVALGRDGSLNAELQSSLGANEICAASMNDRLRASRRVAAGGGPTHGLSWLAIHHAYK